MYFMMGSSSFSFLSSQSLNMVAATKVFVTLAILKVWLGKSLILFFLSAYPDAPLQSICFSLQITVTNTPGMFSVIWLSKSTWNFRLLWALNLKAIEEKIIVTNKVHFIFCFIYIDFISLLSANVPQLHAGRDFNYRSSCKSCISNIYFHVNGAPKPNLWVACC